MSSCDVSIILPTFNRYDRLRRVVQALKAQDVSASRFEIIVISDGSSDGTDDFLRSLASTGTIRAVFQANQGPAAARNAGIAIAGGELIVFVDDDVVPCTTFLSEHLQAHARAADDVAVIGPLLSPPDFTMLPWVDWEQRMLLKQYDAMTQGKWTPTARQFYTGNASILRKNIVAAGGFDPVFRRAEDVELAYRLSDRGLKFVFEPAAIGWHYAERSFQSWLGVATAYGRNDAIFARDHDQKWLVPTVQWEFSQRKWPQRVLVRTCATRPRLSAGVSQALGLMAAGFGAVGVARAQQVAYSALFNLHYFRSFVQTMGNADILAGAPQTNDA